MSRKRNPYIQLFTRDILSSPRCRALSEAAAGVYLFLLCRLNEPPTPGAYRISDWEQHPNWKRSKTQQCLATPDKYERLTYFASMLAKNDLPWKQGSILSGLQELYRYGIIVVEGDMLVQPRMLRDNKFRLPDLDHDGDPVNTILDEPASGSMVPENDVTEGDELSENNVNFSRTKNGTKKVQKKCETRAHARKISKMRVEPIYNNSNKRVVGEKESEGANGGEVKKKGIDTPKKAEKGTQGAQKDGDKELTAKTEKVRQKAQKPPKRATVADNPPSLEDVQAYFEERKSQGKPFIYIDAETFYDACCQSGWTLNNGKPMLDWQARVRTFENYRRDHGDRPLSAKTTAPPTRPAPVAVNDTNDYSEKF